MTSQKDQIQALITDIDSVLQKTTPRLPWVVSGEMTQQRQVLERVRNYLVNFQRRQLAGEGFEPAGTRPDLLAHDIYYQPSQPSYPSPQGGSQAERSQAYSQNDVTAQQMLQTIVQEMGYLRSSLMQPLQSDVEGLRQQRDVLAQEIRQLEAQRQGYAGQLPGQQQAIAEFLQALMSRLQETLPQQVAQTLRSGNQQSLPYGDNLALTGSAPAIAQTSDSPLQGFGNIQVAQSQSDELLIKLDSTLSVVFESLQRNVQAYEESLSQGLNKMHSLGQQGEMMFTALVSHLANQLGQEASSYLQPPASRPEASRSANPTTGGVSSLSSAAKPPEATVSSLLEQPYAEAALPFPGTEISNSFADTATAPNLAEPSVDAAIDSWLRSAGNTDVAPGVDLEIAELNLEGFDLNQLAAQDVNALLELDANLLGMNLSPQPMLAPEPGIDRPTQPIATEPTSSAMSVEDTADIDAALKLLEQLSSELQEQPTSVANADAEIDRMLSTPSTLPGEAVADSIPDDARDELDEFYESLFGNQSSVVEPPSEVPVAVEASQTSSAPVEAVEAVEPAIALSITEPVNQPLDTQSLAVQPIDTLPAETQAPVGTLAASAIVAPAVSVGVDPTLGWDLLSKPLVDQAAEPDIPAALLEDELLNGWDFEDADIDLVEPELLPADDDLFGELDDLLGVGEPAATGDRALNLIDAPSSLPTDATKAPVAQQSPDADTSSEVLAATAFSAEPLTNLDEIATLTDLFGEPDLADGLPVEPPTAAPTAPAERLSQPPVSPPTSAAQTLTPVGDTSDQILPADPADDRLEDDRYTPASPGEDLLPIQETIAEPEAELWLDESTLSRLSEDLFSLEDAIGDPSILPYDAAGTDAPALFPDALHETEPLSEPMSLADWNASLDEAAGALPITDSTQTSFEPEQRAIAAEPPEAFILEGMDDLFANTPIVPPVTPASPPLPAQAESSAAFTLEGMNDLFDDPSTSTAPLPSVATPTNQPLPFTLEGMDDLFGDVPAVSEPADQPLPFTFEVGEDLFADVLPVAASLPVVPEVAATALPPKPSEPVFAFNLEPVDSLFVAVPSTQAEVPSADLEVPSANVEAPSANSPADPFNLEGMLAPAPEPSPELGTTPFTFEQVGDLFMEMPSETSPVLDERSLDERSTVSATTSVPQSSEPPPAPFTLEQVGNLFVETPSGNAVINPTAPSPSASATEPSTLEQAFASLMGSFGEPEFPPSETETQDPEKKKGMS